MYSFSDLSRPLKIFSGPNAAPYDTWEWEGVLLKKIVEKKKKHVIIFRALFNFYSFSDLSGPLKIFSGAKAAPNDTWEWEGILLKKNVEN